MRILRLFLLDYLVAIRTSWLVLCSLAEPAPPDNVSLKRPIKFTTQADTDWQLATGTLYGDPNGDGSEGGACGYHSLVKLMPFQSKVAAASSDLFKAGKGCGACYQVKCTDNSLCSEIGVSVVITDQSPGETHFDLSGTAFGGMAFDPTRVGDLCNAGTVSLLFRGRKRSLKQLFKYFIIQHIVLWTHRVAEGASNSWFAVFIVYEDGDGDLGAVYLKQATSDSWQAMQQIWGVNWALTSGVPLQAPFSIRLSTLSTGKTLTATDVTPQNWQPNATYRSVVNFD